MSEQPKTHPTQEVLKELLLGRLKGKKAFDVESHVIHCESCCEQLEILNNEEDDFLVPLKSEPLFSKSDTLLTSDTMEVSGQSHEASEPALAGKCVGPYRLVELLGTGGMGSVYKAWHAQLDRLVALKMLHAERLHDPQSAIRFSAEAESVARLQHPNIIRLYDSGRHKNQPYFAMELIEGGNLSKAIAEGPFGAQAAAKMIKTLATAIHYAHEMGVVHRDLKPANILLTRPTTGHLDFEAVPKIADFGIAKQLDTDSDLTQTGMLAGTPNYMAPEQIRGQSREIGPRTDIYALGVILYELLTGKTPFAAATPLEVMNQILESTPSPPSTEGVAIPQDLTSICLQCLHKESSRRYVSAKALADDLERFLAGQTVAARRASPIERSWRWARRRPALTALLTVVTLLAAVGFPAVSWLWLDTIRARDMAQQSEKTQRWSSYRMNLLAAGSFLQLKNNTAARKALEAAPEEHRNWEWLHYQQSLEGARLTLPSHESAIYAIAFQPDGKRMVTVSEEKIQLWDPLSGEIIYDTTSQSRAKGRHTFASFSPDGRFFASMGPEGTVVVRDSENGNEVQILNSNNGDVIACQYSPDGKLLLTYGAEVPCCNLWDTHTNTLLQRINLPSAIYCVAFDADTNLLALALKNGRAGVWDVQSGLPLAQWDTHEAAMTAVAFSPDSTILATAAEYPESLVQLRSVPEGKLVASLEGHSNAVYAIDFSPDGSVLASASTDHTVRLWDGKNGKPLGELKHAGSVFDVQFSPDGKLLASAAQDRALRLWNTSDWELISLLQGFEDTVSILQFDPTGSILASGALDHSLSLWDMELCGRGDSIRGHEGFVYDVAFSPDGKQFASAAWDGTFRIWDVSSGQEISKFPAVNDVATGIAFDSSGEKFAAADRKALTVWNTISGKLLFQKNLPQRFYPDRQVALGPGDRQIAFSSDGCFIATGTPEGEVLLFDPKTGELKTRFIAHDSACRDVAFSPDSRHLITAGHDSLCHVWNARTYSRIATLQGHKSHVISVVYNHSGTLIATCSSDGTVRIWDGKDFTLQSILDHGVYVYDASFSPDSRRLAVACDDNYIRLWDVRSGDMVAQLHGHKAYVHGVSFSPDGTQLVSASGDKTIRLWNTQSRATRK